METKPATTKKGEMQEYTLTSANSILKLADELAKFIKDRRLTQNIQGKDFVLVEAWTFAGMSMGLMPVPTEVIDLSTEGEIKYKAVVELLNIHTNTVVGRGFAICSNKEKGKKFFEEYAIASMAQTRATGKAYRLPLGFLMKAAGYEATPAEEMDFQVNEAGTGATVVEPAPAKATPAPAADKAPASLTPATNKQKSELTDLLKHPAIPREKVTATLLKINTLDEVRMQEAIKWAKGLVAGFQAKHAA